MSSIISSKISGEEFDRATAIAARKEEAKKIRRKKKRTASSSSLASNTFQVDLNHNSSVNFVFAFNILLYFKEIYRLTNELLGRGAYATVET